MSKQEKLPDLQETRKSEGSFFWLLIAANGESGTGRPG
jgi:hypothetical protein